MIELKDLQKTYGAGSAGVAALRGVSLSVAAGEFVAIMGPSGSGKSTLLHCIGFLDRPDHGSYLLEGRDVTKLSDDERAFLRNRTIGFVFQQFHLLARNTALENAELPLIYAGKRHLTACAAARLDEVGLRDRRLHRPNQLSGGEQQRVAIARALVNDPPLILADEPTGNLDSKSQEEIMMILERLNAAGKTIVMVTHEEEVAEHARRVIRMRDGRIVSDETQRSMAAVAAPSGGDLPGAPSCAGTGPGIQQAEIKDHLRQALWSITSHKMRSALSMLGILIGVAAVIAMLALGQGAKESIEQTLSHLGSNLLMVRPGSQKVRGVAQEAGAVTRFTFQDADAFRGLPHVKRVSPAVSGKAQAVYGNKNWSTQVEGTGVDYAQMRASVPTVGHFFTPNDLRSRKKVALLGTTVAAELFGGENPVGRTIKMNRINFQVIGVLPSKGATGWRDRDDTVVIPVTTAMYRLLGKEYLDSIDVEVDAPGNMEAVQEAIEAMVIKRHRLTGERKDSFQIRNMADIRETLEQTTKTMSMLLGSIAAISLLVGGIGIMNIMLVSVTERTREIGLRKALGARRSDIMVQFLIEAVAMTVTGGVAGVVTGSAIALLLALVAGWTVKVSLFSIVLATGFSVAVGLVFGLWPARQAAGLDPIEALRYE